MPRFDCRRAWKHSLAFVCRTSNCGSTFVYRTPARPRYQICTPRFVIDNRLDNHPLNLRFDQKRQQHIGQLLDQLDKSSDPDVCATAAQLRHAIGHLNDSLVQWTDKAFTDPLTGLANRRALEQLVKTKASLLLIDLDGFKQINDTQGHVVGDQVLIQVSKAFRAQLRTNDLLFRLGGDEFLVVLQTGTDVAQSVAKRLQQSLLGSGVSSFSYGTLAVQDDWPIVASLEQLDRQMYNSKRRIHELP